MFRKYCVDIFFHSGCNSHPLALFHVPPTPFPPCSPRSSSASILTRRLTLSSFFFDRKLCSCQKGRRTLSDDRRRPPTAGARLTYRKKAKSDPKTTGMRVTVFDSECAGVCVRVRVWVSVGACEMNCVRVCVRLWVQRIVCVHASVRVYRAPSSANGRS